MALGLTKEAAYRAQHGVHELVRLLGPHETSDLEHTESQPGDDGGMLGQRLLQDLAIGIVIFEGTYFWDTAEALKGSEV